MFNWKKRLLSSLDIKKQEKALDKKHTVDVHRLISKRLFDNNNGSYVGGNVSIDDRPFTDDERNTKKYERTRAEQIKNKEPVMVEVPSTAIANARFDEDKGAIYIRYVGDNDGKEYVFAGDKTDWLKFMNAGSKGRYVQHIMKVKNRAPKSWY